MEITKEEEEIKEEEQEEIEVVAVTGAMMKEIKEEGSPLRLMFQTSNQDSKCISIPTISR
jgi:hypothetical protein